MSAVLKIMDGGDDGKYVVFYCPGCKRPHAANVEKPNRWGAKWAFDGNEEQPTLSPSVNYVGSCHFFVRAGHIEFCSDSKHALAGRTVPMEPMPEEWQ
jgi:hypothetical protein